MQTCNNVVADSRRAADDLGSRGRATCKAAWACCDHWSIYVEVASLAGCKLAAGHCSSFALSQMRAAWKAPPKTLVSCVVPKSSELNPFDRPDVVVTTLMDFVVL